MTRPLDVAIVLSSLGVVRGGLETTAERLAEGLAARGHRVTLVGGGRVPCVRTNLRAWRLLGHRRPGLPLKTQSLSFAAACRLDPRVGPSIAGADVTLTALEVETALVSQWRARRGRPNVSLFPGGIERRWLQRDASVVRLAFGRNVADHARSIGTRIDDVVPLPGPPRSWLDDPYVVRPEARTLVFVGRLERNKGVWDLVAIFEQLAPRFPALRMRLIGDGPERPALERRLAQTRLADRVDFTGAIPPEAVRAELRSADALVFPSHYESWGLALVEAMAVGVPVVASDTPGSREVGGDAARLLLLGEPAAWVDTIASLVGDDAERRQLSEAGRTRAARFTAEHAVGIMESWLYRALERGVPARGPAGRAPSPPRAR